MTTLETKRLKLIPLSDEHLAGLTAINSDPEVMAYIGIGTPMSEAESQAMIDRVKPRWASHGFSWWGVCRKDDNLMIGAATLQPLATQTGAVPEIGWRLRRDCWGKGYATEAAERIVLFAKELGIPEVVAVANPENIASIAVMKRLGMRYRGIETHYNVPCVVYQASLSID